MINYQLIDSHIISALGFQWFGLATVGRVSEMVLSLECLLSVVRWEGLSTSFLRTKKIFPRQLPGLRIQQETKTTVSKVVHAAKGAFSLLSQEQRLDQVLLVAQALPVGPRLCWVTQINVCLFSCVSRLPKGRHIQYRLFTSRFATWIFFLFCFVF